MAIYRSEFFWKNKKWYSDFNPKTEEDNTVDNRIKHDIKRFMAHTGLVKTVVESMFKQVCTENADRKLWKEIYGWTMVDLGKVEA